MRATQPQRGSHALQLFSPSLRAAILLALLVSAFSLRIYGLTIPPLNFHPTRQYHSAIIARGYFLDARTDLPQWMRDVTRINAGRQALVEPPIMERLAAGGYRVAGGEHLWIPRALAALFWTLGGAAIFLIASRIASPDAALFSAAYYLFLPFGVVASTSFQPDPLMVMLILWGILALCRHDETPSPGSAAMAVALSASVVFVKPVAVFFLWGTAAALSLQRRGIRATLWPPRLPVYFLLSAMPFLAYFLYWKAAGGLKGTEEGRLIPSLLLHCSYWLGWLGLARRVVGYGSFAAAAAGALLLIRRRGQSAALMAGLWSGYFAFGLLFTYHIHTHDYYSLPLIPLVALSVSGLAAPLLSSLSRAAPRGWGVTAAVAVLAAGSAWGAAASRLLLACPRAAGEVRDAHEIGALLSHSQRTIFLAPNYGKTLLYYGNICGMYWPTRYDLWAFGVRGEEQLSVDGRFRKMNGGGRHDFFIVTLLDDFEKQPELKRFLDDAFPVLVRKPGYLIYDLRSPATPGRPRRS